MASTAPRSKTAASKTVGPAKFSIAAAEKEWSESERPAPFDVELPDGERIVLADPQDLDWKVAASLNGAEAFYFFRQVLSPEDYEKLHAAEFRRATMEMLMSAYQEHYQLGEEGN